MAVFNEILVGRFNRGLQKVFGTKGDPPAPSLAGEIAPVFEVFTGIEEHNPQGIEHFSALASIVAVAAQTPTFQLRNPVGSGIIIVVEKLTISPVVAQDSEISIGSVTTDLAATSTGQDRDGRGRANASGIVSSSAASIGALGNPLWIANGGTSPIDAITRTTDEIVLFAGGGLRVTWSAVNQAVRVAIYWRERVREDSEVT